MADCCESINGNSCNEVVTIGWLKSFTANLKNSSGGALNTVLNGMNDNYCPKASEILSWFPRHQVSNGNWQNNLDGLEISQNAGDVVRVCDVTGYAYTFVSLTLSNAGNNSCPSEGDSSCPTTCVGCTTPSCEGSQTPCTCSDLTVSSNSSASSTHSYNGGSFTVGTYTAGGCITNISVSCNTSVVTNITHSGGNITATLPNLSNCGASSSYATYTFTVTYSANGSPCSKTFTSYQAQNTAACPCVYEYSAGTSSNSLSLSTCDATTTTGPSVACKYKCTTSSTWSDYSDFTVSWSTSCGWASLTNSTSKAPSLSVSENCTNSQRSCTLTWVASNNTGQIGSGNVTMTQAAGPCGGCGSPGGCDCDTYKDTFSAETLTLNWGANETDEKTVKISAECGSIRIAEVGNSGLFNISPTGTTTLPRNGVVELKVSPKTTNTNSSQVGVAITVQYFTDESTVCESIILKAEQAGIYCREEDWMLDGSLFHETVTVPCNGGTPNIADIYYDCGSIDYVKEGDFFSLIEDEYSGYHGFQASVIGTNTGAAKVGHLYVYFKSENGRTLATKTCTITWEGGCEPPAVPCTCNTSSLSASTTALNWSDSDTGDKQIVVSANCGTFSASTSNGFVFVTNGSQTGTTATGSASSHTFTIRSTMNTTRTASVKIIHLAGDKATTGNPCASKTVNLTYTATPQPICECTNATRSFYMSTNNLSLGKDKGSTATITVTATCGVFSAVTSSDFEIDGSATGSAPSHTFTIKAKTDNTSTSKKSGSLNVFLLSDSTATSYCTRGDVTIDQQGITCDCDSFTANCNDIVFEWDEWATGGVTRSTMFTAGTCINVTYTNSDSTHFGSSQQANYITVWPHYQNTGFTDYVSTVEIIPSYNGVECTDKKCQFTVRQKARGCTYSNWSATTTGLTECCEITDWTLVGEMSATCGNMSAYTYSTTWLDVSSTTVNSKTLVYVKTKTKNNDGSERSGTVYLAFNDGNGYNQNDSNKCKTATIKVGACNSESCCDKNSFKVTKPDKEMEWTCKQETAVSAATVEYSCGCVSAASLSYSWLEISTSNTNSVYTVNAKTVAGYKGPESDGHGTIRLYYSTKPCGSTTDSDWNTLDDIGVNIKKCECNIEISASTASLDCSGGTVTFKIVDK